MKITDLLIQLDQAINASTILNMVVQNMISLFNSVFFFFDLDKKNMTNINSLLESVMSVYTNHFSR